MAAACPIDAADCAGGGGVCSMITDALADFDAEYPSPVSALESAGLKTLSLSTCDELLRLADADISL
jgi:hypothetical protein